MGGESRWLSFKSAFTEATTSLRRMRPRRTRLPTKIRLDTVALATRVIANAYGGGISAQLVGWPTFSNWIAVR